MFKKIIRSIFYGNRTLQPFYRKLHRNILLGMNYGGDPRPSYSGEDWLITYLAHSYTSGAVLDVGANTGDYSLLLASSFPAHADLHAFEPSPAAYEILRERLASHPAIHLHNIGFGERAMDVTLYSNTKGSGLASLYLRRLDHRNTFMNSQEQIHIDQLDQWVEKNNVNDIYFLKIDVEGNELNVLKGAEKLIANGRIRYIQFEFGGCNIDSRTFWQDFWYLLSPNYTLSRLIRGGIVPMRSYDERDEIFTMTNYFAELKDRKKS